jgi:hypothetical protein
MILTGVTGAMLEKARREEPLLHDCTFETIEEVTKAMHEQSCGGDPGVQEEWDRLPPGTKRMAVQDAAWLIGRLARAGYAIVKVGSS